MHRVAKSLFLYYRHKLIRTRVFVDKLSLILSKRIRAYLCAPFGLGRIFLSLLLILSLSLQPVMGAQINDSIFMSPQADPYSLALRSGLGDPNIGIIITDEEAQDQLVEDGVTEDLAALNADPDQAQVITRDERNAVDFYVSDQAVKAMIEAGALLKDIIAEILDREGFGALGQAVSDGQLSAKDALDQLKACQTSSQQGFNLYEIFITTAHAAECVLTTVTGKDIVVSDVDGCAKAIIKAAFTAAWNGRTSAPALAEGIKNGLIKEGEQYLELLSDPAALASAMTEFAYQAWKDPSKLAELGINIVDGMQTNAYEYLAAMVAEDYEKAGEHMAALTLDLAIKIIAPAAGASLSALAAIKGMDKIISATRRVAPNKGLPDNGIDYSKLSTAKPHQATKPRDLNEQTVWNGVLDNPSGGRNIDGLNNDPRFKTEDGFQKMEASHKLPSGESITVHYQYNSFTGKPYDMKFTTPQRTPLSLQPGPSLE